MSGIFILSYSMNLMLIVLLTSIYSELPRLFKFRTQLSVLILVISTNLVPLLGPSFLKPILILLTIIFANYIYKKRDLREILISSFILELLIISSELVMIFLFIIIYSVPNTQSFLTEYNQTIFSVFSLIYIYCLSLFRFPGKIYNYIDEKTEYVPKKSIFIVFSFLVGTTTFIVYTTFFKIHFIVFIIIAILLFGLFTQIVLATLRNKNEYQIVKKKYENAIFNMKEYETTIDMYKIRAHEEKNQFVIVRNLVLMDESQQAKTYINNILKLECTKEEEATFRLNNIPCVPLRAIMYNKFSAMKKLEIEYSLLVSKEVRVSQFNEFSELVAYDLTRIFSVFIDNAIDEVKKIKKGCIYVDIYLENKNFIIEISNTIKTKIDFDQLGDPGYTTKTDGHGYGLSLVKEILEKSKVIKNERYLYGDMFKQKIIIKI